MKYFGCGLPKTGTLSTAVACEQLGIKTKHNPIDPATIEQLLLGNFQLKVLDEYDAIFDLPAACFYKEYDLAYPNSKFILTTRDKFEWLKSCKQWWTVTFNLTNAENIFAINTNTNNSLIFLTANMFGIVGFDERIFTRVYDRWNAECISYFSNRPQSLLVLDVSDTDKWQKLIAFLDRPMDLLQAPFPHENKQPY